MPRSIHPSPADQNQLFVERRSYSVLPKRARIGLPPLAPQLEEFSADKGEPHY
jgi:hypothetical protein